MKSKEFYREQIIQACKQGEACTFRQRYVLPTFDQLCENLGCNCCDFLTLLWLDDEYVEPVTESGANI